jgi:hypothetical protein
MEILDKDKKVVLGIRNSPKCVRYAILEHSQNGVVFKNRDSINNTLEFPKSKTDYTKLEWLYEELKIIQNKYQDISEVVIKTNEYGQRDKAALRSTAYLDAVVMLFFTQKKIPVESKVYRSLGSKSVDVLMQAESLVRKMDSKWDKQIADAIVAAHSLLNIDRKNYVQ